MKVCIIQPKYYEDYSKSDECFKQEIDFLDKCDESIDLIVLPESADIPCLAKTKEDADKSAEKYNKILLDKASETAKRCNAILFVNARCKMENGSLRNTTFAFK